MKRLASLRHDFRQLKIQRGMLLRLQHNEYQTHEPDAQTSARMGNVASLTLTKPHFFTSRNWNRPTTTLHASNSKYIRSSHDAHPTLVTAQNTFITREQAAMKFQRN
jgi:hypothetical protein